MYTPYVRISSGALNTTLDTTARNTLGSIYAPPANPNGPTSAKGYGAQPVVKYVQYVSTSNPTPSAAPAPVYYTDESFTIVSGNAAEAFVTTGGLYVAGYLLVNSTSYSGLTATILNNSYCFIQIGGLLVGAAVPTTSPGAGNFIVGSTTGNWASTGTSAAPTQRVLGIQLAAAVSSVCDVLVSGTTCFWGS